MSAYKIFDALTPSFEAIEQVKLPWYNWSSKDSCISTVCSNIIFIWPDKSLQGSLRDQFRQSARAHWEKQCARARW